MNNKVFLDPEPIHGMFELSYASYLVLPRSILQSTPIEWQNRFVKCIEELEDMFGGVPEKASIPLYHVGDIKVVI